MYSNSSDIYPRRYCCHVHELSSPEVIERSWQLGEDDVEVMVFLAAIK